LGLEVLAGAREVASNPAQNTDVTVYHGSIDAPAVDVYESSLGATVANDFTYRSFSGSYATLPFGNYYFEVRNSNQTATIAAVTAPLTGDLAGAGVLVLASGYLNPTANQPAFGVFAVAPSGGAFIELPATTVRAQVIHNAEGAAVPVDLWINDMPTNLTGLDYRNSTPFVDLNAGIQMVSVTAAGATNTDNAPIEQTVELKGGESYVIIADGDVTNQPLALNAFANAREEASDPANTDVLLFHGSVDAPAVNIVETTAGPLSSDLAYGQFDGYLELSTADYEIDVNAASYNSTVATYSVPLNSLNLNGAAVTAVASGYLAPGTDQPMFGIWVSLASGGLLVELPVVASTNEDQVRASLAMYPNPASSNLSIENADNIQNVTVINSEGQIVKEVATNNTSVSVPVNDLTDGIYFIRIETEAGTATNAITVE
jgi:hypothetical protein